MGAPSTRHTVASLRALRGTRQLAMLRVETLEEAAAAEAAGVELLSIPPALLDDPRFRQVAPAAFVFPGLDFHQVGGADDFLRWSFAMLGKGADAVYCSGSLASVKLMAENAVPVCGHVGLIPSRRTWSGGFRAVGKTLDQAKRVWDGVRALEEAGAFAAEIEVVPAAITAAIAARTSLFLLSMGGGAAGDAQYLFSDDVLGQNRGHVPRHAKAYADLAAEYDRLQALRVSAMAAFAAEVHGGAYPSPEYLVQAEAEVVAAFGDWLKGQ